MDILVLKTWSGTLEMSTSSTKMVPECSSTIRKREVIRDDFPGLFRWEKSGRTCSGSSANSYLFFRKNFEWNSIENHLRFFTILQVNISELNGALRRPIRRNFDEISRLTIKKEIKNYLLDNFQMGDESSQWVSELHSYRKKPRRVFPTTNSFQLKFQWNFMELVTNNIH